MTSNPTKSAMCKTKTPVGRRRLRNSTYGGTVEMARSTIKTHGSLQLNVKSRIISVAIDHEKENLRIKVREVDIATNRCKSATVGTSGALSSSSTKICRPNKSG